MGYPPAADDDEFLKRATLASTLILDGLQTEPTRQLLRKFGANLHQTFESKPKPLGSRNLLERLTLAAELISRFQPDPGELGSLIQQAEGRAKKTTAELQSEFETAQSHVRGDLAPLAFLYDLRTHGGLAHQPNTEKAAAAAGKLGLPRRNWHRTDFLSLLKLIAESIDTISDRLEDAADTMRG